MKSWKEQLKHDPIPPLLSCKNKAIIYFVKRDLLEQKVNPIESLWELPSAIDILKKQQEEGFWKYPGKVKENLRWQEDYNQIETFRNLGVLVEKFGFNKNHLSIQKAAKYLLSKQTSEGDIRGIYATQYSPNYTAAILEQLIKAGYEDNETIRKGLDWLLSIRQDDGGWTIALRTLKIKWEDAFTLSEPLLPDKKKPFSHMITGVVLRPFAIHSDYQKRDETQHAGRLLMSRFFQNDKYSDRKDKSYWLKFSFPFWFTDLISALDSLVSLGFSKKEQQIRAALDWFISQQKEDGTWDLSMLRSKDKDLNFWFDYLICGLFKKFY
ncbi:MAG: hypothetical protein ACFFBP_17900 [Promethearchaeota archaeon]